MKTRFTGILTLLLALVVQVTFAQEKTVSGTVYEASGAPLPGASVVVRGSTVGTQTDFDGNYAIKASVGDVLVFSYVGMEPKNVTVGASNTINVTLEEGLLLEEVIVTAQGIKREKKALGYAVAEVGSDQLEQRAEGDIGRVLSGKASGVQIVQQSGISGSGTSIFIRGLSTFSGSNQPLFIVDGVPFNSDTNAQDNFVNGNNGSSRFLDLDPNSIENINVLKGLAAATLYGTQGRNGVILITTKNGMAGTASNKKFEATFSSSFFQTELASTPDYQDEFGNGFDQAFGWFFSNWGPAFRFDGIDGFGQSGAIAPDGTVPHPFSTASFRADFPEFAGVRYEYKPYQSVERFFRTGQVAQNNLNLSGTSSDGKMAFNMNMSHLEDKGFTPGNKLTRNNFGLGGKAELSNNFTINGTLNYARTDFISPPVAAGDGNTTFGGNSSVFSNVFFTPRSVDLMGLPFENPRDGSSVYYRQNNSIQHPLWTIENAQTRQITNRVFGNGTIDYKLNDNLSFTYRLGIDVFAEDNVNQQNKGGVSDDAAVRSGFYQTWTNTNTIWDHNFIINGQYQLTDDIGMTFNVGATSRRELFDRQGVASTGQLVFDVFRHFNFQLQDEIQTKRERNTVGVYGQADFDYKRFLYLTLSGRNDWVSNLSVDNRSIFYPSASVSFIPTSAFDGFKNSKVLNYLKIRAGVGTSANFPTGFPVSTNLNLTTQRFQDSSGSDVVVNSISNTLGNPDLEPETLTEFEGGIESTWLNNRLRFEASAYFRITEDLIVDRDLDPSTGFSSTQTNVGEIEGKGVELDISGDIFKSQSKDGFNWTVNANWTINESEVTDLGDDIDVLVFAGFTDLGNAAIEGKPLGVMIGSRIQRNDQGEFLVDSQGNYIIEQGQFVIGDPNPDWILNISNSFSYKGFTLSSLINYTHGGDIYSQTIATLLGRGLIQETANRRETFVLPGVQQSTGQPNTVQINNSGFYFDNVLFGPSELQVYDGSTIRLQEVSLSYSLPKTFLEKTPFGSLSVTASGFNLWWDAVNTPDGANFDPNVAGLGVGNGRGFDFLNGPSSRRYGISVKATF
ncbi:MAG: SusC/RagA family TonB-linked outer membrane protein [Flavobacteriaceae bacterium]|nr:SusC/RagA family TonB-linked outer membrane protein [Flavobacteriaceae bacterium]